MPQSLPSISNSVRSSVISFLITPLCPKIVVARKQNEASFMSFQWVNKSMRSHPLEVARRNLPLLLNSLVLSSAFETLLLISSWLF